MGSVIGEIIGGFANNNDERAARDAMSEATGAFRDIKIPTIEEQKIALQQLALQGQLTPELEQEILANPSAFENIQKDQQLREAQMTALKSLKDIGQMGLTPEDRAMLNQTRNEVNQQDKARQDAIMQNMAARGMGGSGAELAQKLASAQSATDRASSEGDRLAAQAMARKLQAIAQSGQLAGNMSAQDFSEAAQGASAADAINKFNVQNQVGVQQRNVSSKNTAQATNLAEKQRIADQNVGLQNQQEMYNKQLAQQEFQNKLNRASGLAGQLRMNQQQYNNDAAATQAMYGKVGKGIEEGAKAIITGGMPIPGAS